MDNDNQENHNEPYNKNKEPGILRFRKMTLDDIGRIREYFSYSTNNTCDHTAGSTLMWRDFFSMEYAIYNDTLITKLEIKDIDAADTVAFYLPLGSDRDGAISKINEYCQCMDIPVVFCIVTSDELPLLSAFYDDMDLFHDTDWSDYVYRASDMTSLAGRKYNGQRNHINHFKRTYQTYAFEEISESNIGDVIEFYNALIRTSNKDYDIFNEEQKKTLEVLNNYDTYGLPGGLIRIDKSVAAFSIGEIRGNTLFIHIEKADLKYKGIYQVMNNEYAKHFASHEIEFINRGEDVGDEGLRISKSSYHPYLLLDKYIVTV